MWEATPTNLLSERPALEEEKGTAGRVRVKGGFFCVCDKKMFIR